MTQTPWKHHQTNKCKTKTSNIIKPINSDNEFTHSIRSIHHSQIRLWNFYQISPYSLWLHLKCPYFLNSQRKNLFMKYGFIAYHFSSRIIWFGASTTQTTKQNAHIPGLFWHLIDLMWISGNSQKPFLRFIVIRDLKKKLLKFIL